MHCATERNLRYCKRRPLAEWRNGLEIISENTPFTKQNQPLRVFPTRLIVFNFKGRNLIF